MASTSGPPLWQQLQGAAGVVRQVRQGVSGSAAIESVAAPLRAGVQALAFHAWRNLGRAMALRDQLVQRAPPALTDALLCVTLALLWDPKEALYDEFTLVNQAVEALKRTPSSRATSSRTSLMQKLQNFVDTVTTMIPLWWAPIGQTATQYVTAYGNNVLDQVIFRKASKWAEDIDAHNVATNIIANGPIYQNPFNGSPDFASVLANSIVKQFPTKFA